MSATPSPRPFTLNIADEHIQELKARLARTRLPDQTPGDPWAYGTDVAWLAGLIEHWHERFDWRAQEAALNAFPQPITPSGVVCGFTGPVGRGGGESSPPYRARGVGVADPSTGVLYQSGVGPSSAGVPRIEKHIVNGRLICTTPMSVVHDMNLSTVQSGLNNICVLASDLSTFYPFNVTFVSATVDRCGAVDIDSNVFIASQITSVGGDSARKGIFKMDSSGNLVSAFNPAWAGGTPDILRVNTIGGAVFVMGSWSAAVTIAGQARPNFAVLRADTGALY